MDADADAEAVAVAKIDGVRTLESSWTWTRGGRFISRLSSCAVCADSETAWAVVVARWPERVIGQHTCQGSNRRAEVTMNKASR